jgi:nitrilase
VSKIQEKVNEKVNEKASQKFEPENIEVSEDLETLNVALIQMSSSDQWQKNVETVESLGADIPKGSVVVLPEMWSCLVPDGRGEERAQFAKNHSKEIRNICQNWAREKDWTLVAGSTFEWLDAQGKVANRSLVYGPDGECIAQYDKLHLFDNEIAGGMYRESRTIASGDGSVLVELAAHWKLGLSICYDLRFPHLYQEYSAKGAVAISVPAAFTKKTGEAHWELLLRSRAVENQCYVWACNQAGVSPAGVKCWGHSMVVDPWGKILVEADGELEQVISVSCDPKVIKRVRQLIPVLKHRRSWGGRQDDPRGSM